MNSLKCVLVEKAKPKVEERRGAGKRLSFQMLMSAEYKDSTP